MTRNQYESHTEQMDALRRDFLATWNKRVVNRADAMEMHHAWNSEQRVRGRKSQIDAPNQKQNESTRESCS